MTSACPKNDQISAQITSAPVMTTVSIDSRQGSELKMAMPSALWSSSASLSGRSLLSRGSSLIARLRMR
ncbi:hypothetical protein D3C86_1291300 [compost metagenome]